MNKQRSHNVFDILTKLYSGYKKEKTKFCSKTQSIDMLMPEVALAWKILKNTHFIQMSSVR